MLHLIASIPSPSSGAIHIGKLQLRAYGLMIALGALAAVWLAGRRLEEAGEGKRDDMSAVAMWALPGGVIGARIYHVITDWKSFRGDWLRAFKIWQGGLGIWGGIALGVAAGLWAGHKRGLTTAAMLRASTPALPLAQAIGRWGNWWNQELFGRPTTLPWALEIDVDKRPADVAQFATFHPAFLYESLWNLALCGVLLWVDKKYKPRASKLFALYVAGYTFVRFFLERLRIDPAYKVAGLRVNEWISAIVFLGAVAYLLLGPKSTPALAAAGGDALDGDALDADPVDGVDRSSFDDTSFDDASFSDAAVDETPFEDRADEPVSFDDAPAADGPGGDDDPERRRDPDSL